MKNGKLFSESTLVLFRYSWQPLKYIFFIFLTGALLWLIFGFYRPFEPHYHFKPITLWVADASATDEDGSRDSIETQRKNKRGKEAIRQIGAKALPFALKLCRATDSEFKLKMKVVEKSEELSEWLHIDVHIPSAEEKHWESIIIYSALGDTAKPAIPSLIIILENDSLSADAAAQSLYYIGPNSVPPLIEALTNANGQGRIQVANYLGYYFWRDASNAVSIYLQYLNNSDPILRYTAAKSLVRISNDPIKVVPAIANYLEAETNHLTGQSEIFFGLGRMGTNARPAIPVLIKLAEANQFGALGALHKIDPEIAESIFEKRNVSQTNKPAGGI